LVIKPSGVIYPHLTPDAMVVCDLHGRVVDGRHAPSSDTAAHAYVYRHMPEVGGMVHPPRRLEHALNVRANAQGIDICSTTEMNVTQAAGE